MPSALFAASQPAQEETSEPGFFSFLDSPRSYWSQKFVNFATGIDRFFADERDFQETNDSVFRLDLVNSWQQGGERLFELVGKAKVSLPYSTRRFHLLLESDPEQSVSGDTTKEQQPLLATQVQVPKTYAAAIRFERSEKSVWHFSTDAGMKLKIKLDPYVRMRGSFTMPRGKWRVKLAEQLFWFNSIGAGESTQLDVEHFLNSALLFRATSNATWLVDNQAFGLRQDVALFHELDDRNALVYQVSALGTSEPLTQVTEYVGFVRYRHRLHKSWLFYEIRPELHYPRDKGFDMTPVLNLRLEMMFSREGN